MWVIGACGPGVLEINVTPPKTEKGMEKGAPGLRNSRTRSLWRSQLAKSAPGSLILLLLFQVRTNYSRKIPP